ncbi:MAG: GNAT family N-acetyltransferase [Paracoccaceae bacterium]
MISVTRDFPSARVFPVRMDVALPVAMVEGATLSADDRMADLIWETDPSIFTFIFDSLPVWRRLFPAEWLAMFGTQTAGQTRVAISGRRPVGLVNAFAGSEVPARFGATYARQSAVLDDVAAARMRAAYDAMEWLFPRVPDDALYVLNLVVSPDCRGQDLGRRLVDEAGTKARRLGLRSIHLDTAADNPAAGFYRRIGFRPLVESRAMSLPEGVVLPAHLRMARDVA